MNLEDLKKVTDKLDKGFEFKVFPNLDIIARIVPIDNNKKDVIFSELMVEYFIKNKDEGISKVKDVPQEDIEKISAMALVISTIVDVKGLTDKEGNELVWNYKLAEQMIEEGYKSFFERIFNYVNLISFGGACYEINDNTKKKS